MKFLQLFSAVVACCSVISSYAAIGDADTLYVVREEGKVDIFPQAMLSGITTSDEALELTALDGSTFTYRLAEIQHYGHPLQMILPSITSFKFNNKFNHQLFSDTECEITGDSIISGQLACIGHWLTPSFKVSDKRAEVVLDDSIQLVSKHTRRRMGNEHNITIAYPNIRILKSILTQPAIDIPDQEELQKVALTADMLSTNAPSNYGEDPDNMLDGDVYTYFHSTWGNGIYEKLPADVCPYLDVQLPEAMHTLKFSYTNRQTEGRQTTGLNLYASNDGQTWQLVRSFDADTDNLPSGSLETYTSPTISLDNPCSYLRFEQTQCAYSKNYLCWSEFAIYSVKSNGSQHQDAEYAYQLAPYGRTYQLKLDWLTDHTFNTPSIIIDIENGEYVSSKYYYLNATISMDGAGVFPSMETTDVLIKGRGNSSWSSNAYSKNPYRLKFNEKVKPFGLHGGKNWVLLANRQSGSMLSNAIGLYAAGLIGTEAPNHVVPVDLYLNGEYWGSYNLTEKIGFSNNSLELLDESHAALLELDTYYDESYKFRSSPYNLPVNIQEPDFSEPESTQITLQDIQQRFNAFMSLVAKQADISPEVDVETLARFFVTNELIANYELMHPKSTFLYHENVLADSCRFKWGPVWDLDWAFGYEQSRSYCTAGSTEDFWTRYQSMEAGTFMRQLRGCGEPLDRAIYKAWTIFVNYQLDDLCDYIDDYYALAAPSLEKNKELYTDRDYTNYATSAANAKKWLRQRAKTVYSKLTPYQLTDEELNIEDNADDSPTEDFLPYTDDVKNKSDELTRFDVYDISGTKLKAGATYDNLRNGLKPGLYIVNGRKMLISK